MKGARIAIAVMLVAANASAEPAEEDKALALTLFKRGRELMAEKRIDEACASFAESQRLDPGGGTLLNLAVCHEEQGRTATAWAELEDAIAVARRDQRTDRIDLAREHIAALEPRLSRLVIVPPREVDVRIVRNGVDVPAAALGIAIPVDPGRHVVEAFAGARRVFHAEIDVGTDGDRQMVEVIAAPPVVDVEPTKPTVTIGADVSPRRPVSTRTVVGWSLVGVGATAIGAGTFFGIRALDERSASDAGCFAGRCTTDAAEHNDRAKTYADASTVTIGLGAVAAAAGLVLLLLDR